MGQKVAFATTNWKDRPNKPTGMTQAEWDAYSSSKFNGFPFPIHEKNTDGSDFELWNGLFCKDFSTGEESNYPYEIWLSQSNSESEQTDGVLYGPGTSFPIGFTFDELIQIFWRVKRYNINISLSSGLSISGTTGVTLHINNTWDENYETITTHSSTDNYTGKTEADIPRGYYPGLYSYATMYGAPYAYDFSVSAQLNESSLDDGAEITLGAGGADSFASVYFEISPYVIKPIGQDLYYPSMGLGISAIVPGWNQDELIQVSSGRSAVTSMNETTWLAPGVPAPRDPDDCPDNGYPGCKVVYAQAAGGNISFMGKDIPMFKIAQTNYWAEAFVPPRDPNYPISVNGSIGSPARYWEYDDGNGNPIYDKFTGAELRDPVTGTPV